MHQPQAVCFGIAMLTGVAFASTGARPPGRHAPLAPPVVVAAAAPAQGEGCLAQTLCSLNQKLRRAHAAWSASECRSLAEGVVASAARHGLSPALLVAVMIQESDLNENAARVSHPHGGLAKDSGLMGIRCVLDGRGRCTNGLVRGMAWRQVMEPLANIELGARYLALYRDGAGRSKITVRTRAADGTVQVSTRNVPCRHSDHAYWAHYNHGTRYISRGPARFYPIEVSALYSAVGETLGLDTAELGRGKGRAALAQLDRGTGGRSSALCAAIHATRPLCATPTFTVASR
jgi:hypothetical protein